MLKSQLIQLLAIADERGYTEAAEVLIRELGAFLPLTVSPAYPEGCLHYNSPELDMLSRQKIQWITEFRSKTKLGLLESREEYERRFEGSNKPRRPVQRVDYPYHYTYNYKE